MTEAGIGPIRATLLVLGGACYLAGSVLLGLKLGHPWLGALTGYLLHLLLTTMAFRNRAPGPDLRL